jgi:hypothetical protein
MMITIYVSRIVNTIIEVVVLDTILLSLRSIGCSWLLLSLVQEIGWSSSLYPALELVFGHSAFLASTITGLLWAVWHWPFIIAEHINAIPAGSGYSVVEAQSFELWSMLVIFTTLLVGGRLIMCWIQGKTSHVVWSSSVYHASHSLYVVYITRRGSRIDILCIYLYIVKRTSYLDDSVVTNLDIYLSIFHGMCAGLLLACLDDSRDPSLRKPMSIPISLAKDRSVWWSRRGFQLAFCHNCFVVHTLNFSLERGITNIKTNRRDDDIIHHVCLPYCYFLFDFKLLILFIRRPLNSFEYDGWTVTTIFSTKCDTMHCAL